MSFILKFNIGIVCFLFLTTNCLSQYDPAQKDQYIISEGQQLQIVVHIWGEVNRPGQYLVPDGTNLLELISLASGPTQFSNLGSVKLTRELVTTKSQSKDKRVNRQTIAKKKVIEIDLKEYLNNTNSETLPILRPGDVVLIQRNLWSRWQNLMRIVSQVAIVFQALYFYSRID